MQDGLITLACPSCGAKLEITADIERFVCLHCGTQQLIKRGGGIISIHPLVEGIARVQQGTDRTAAELAIRRLTEEIAKAKEEELAAKSVAMRQEETPAKVRLPASPFESLSLWSAILFLVAGVSNLGRLEVCFPFGLLGLILAVTFVLINRDRLKKEQLTNQEVQLAQAAVWDAEQSAARARAEHVARLEKALEENRRIVNS